MSSMKLRSLVLVLLGHLCPSWSVAIVTFEFFDSRTGLLVSAVRTTQEQIDVGQDVSAIRYCFDASGYVLGCKTLRDIGHSEQRHYRVFLDPVEDPAPLRTHQVSSNGHVYMGYVSTTKGVPVSGVEVVLDAKTPVSLGLTRSDGFFSVVIPVRSVQEEVRLSFVKNGVTLMSYVHLLVWRGGVFTDIVQFDQTLPATTVDHGRSRTASDGGLEPDLDRLLPPLQTDRGGSYSVCSGEMITIGFAGSVGSYCSSCNCTVSQMYSMDTYTRHVMAAEWLGGNWQNLSGIAESYRAAAVAIRTFGAFFIVNPLCAAYDLCAGPACQAFSTTTNPMMNQAVVATSGYFLWDTPNSEEALAQYSSENNNLWQTHCISTYSEAPLCADGYFGRSVTGSPCFSDPPGQGYIRYGHGKGLSQVGSARWATGLDLGDWCSTCAGQSTIYGLCATSHSYGTKTWQQILSHYYSYYELINCSSGGCSQPANDGCLGSSAVLLPMSTTCTFTAATSCGATSSGFSSCSGTQDDDVFFRFVANATTALVSVSPSTGYDAAIQVLTGPCGSGMQQVGSCMNNNGSGGTEALVVSGLTIGTQYFVRVWHMGTGYGTTGNFNICVVGQASSSVDLDITTASVDPVVVSAGGEVTLSYTVVNTGTGTIDTATETGVYLVPASGPCPTSFPTSGFIEDNSLSISEMSDGTDNESPSVIIPAGTPSGQYYLVLVADYLNELDETDDVQNNIFCVPLTVSGSLPDLAVSNGSLNVSTLCPGQLSELTVTIENIGGPGGVVNLSQVGLWAIPQAQGCPIDIPVSGGTFIDDVNLFASEMEDDIQVVNTPVIFPVLPTGSYWLAVVADYDTDQDELDEVSNNILCIPFTISTTTPPPQAQITGDLSICPGETTTLTIGNFFPVSYNYNWSTGPNTQSITVSTGGTYTVTVSSQGNCNQSIQSQVTVVVGDGANAGTNGQISLCSNGGAVQLISGLGGAPTPGGTWTFNGAPHGNSFQPGQDQAGVYTYTVTGGTCGTASATVTVQVFEAPNAGVNSTLTVCSTGSSTNLFASLGGSPDGGGTWSGPSVVSNGLYIPSTMSPGVYTYSVQGTGPCTSSSATVLVVENEAPNAGSPGLLSTCSTSAPTNLFTQLGGTPAPGGSWSGPSPVVNGQYNPATMSPGAYVYTVVGTPPCNSATATVTVTESQAPNAGSNGALQLCSSGASVALISALGGTPQSGGSWTGPSLVTNGQYDPVTMLPGVYEYTVVGAPSCGTSTANVVVTENLAPDAGTNGELSLCSSDGSVSLISALGGTPQGTGSWTGPGSVSVANGMFEPSSMSGGLYIYTVPGLPPCIPASSTVLVELLVVGTPCDDGSAATVNDTLDVNCICVGELPTGIDHHSANNGLPAVLPNPSTGNFRVLFPNIAAPMPIAEVLDALGRKISYHMEVISSNEILLNLGGNAPGVYYLRYKQDGRLLTVELMLN